jgi:hypothetical protein
MRPDGEVVLILASSPMGMEEIPKRVGELRIPVAKRDPVYDPTQRSIVEADAACKVCHDSFPYSLSCRSTTRPSARRVIAEPTGEVDVSPRWMKAVLICSRVTGGG